ncbi:MAG: hypothetical protein GX605_06965, partial [Chloroflexi bacterium]|nr:hypothetical protein [Chloroflexota bacterium]
MDAAQRLAQRQAKLRQAMEAAGYDALIVTGDGDGGHKGFVRYVSEWRIVDGVVWVVFPREGDPTMVLNYGSQAYWARQAKMVPDVRTALDKTGEVLKVVAEK